MKLSIVQIVFSRVIFISFIAFVNTTSVMADPYVGVAVGTASYDVDLGANGSFEEDGTATKIYAGYNFNKYYAAEVTIYNFSEASVGAVENPISPGSPISAEASMKGFGAYAVGMYPVSKEFNLSAKLGVLSWDADVRINTTNAENDGTDVAYGLGISYAFTKELLATAEWEAFDSDNPELSMLSIGFKVIIN